MAKTLCKGIKKNGDPCRGRGLPQYDGYCIAHGPPADQTHQWRSLGGQNSSTAARLDKRIPERLKKAIDQIDDGMTRVLEGTLEPAALTAMCRGAKAKVDLYRLADEEMETIRAEETQKAAAEIAGVQADLELLEAAVDISARQDQYRTTFLIDQGLAQLDPSSDPNEAPQVVLTDEGRRRFGYRRACTLTQLEIDEWEEILDLGSFSFDELHELCQELSGIHSNVIFARDDATLEPSPPRDPLTGQPMSELPACVKGSLTSEFYAPGAAPSAEFLENRLSQVNQLFRKVGDLHKEKLAHLGSSPSPAGVASGSDLASTTIGTNGEIPQSEPS